MRDGIVQKPGIRRHAQPESRRHAQANNGLKANQESGRTSAAELGRNVGRLLADSLSGRDGAIVLLFLVLTIVIFARLLILTVVDAEALAAEGSQIRTTYIELSARRGTIYDRNGNVLATSVDAITIYANPTKIVDAKETAGILAEVLGGNASDYYEKITEDPTSTFVYIAKKVDLDYKQRLQAINQEFIAAAVAALRASGDDIPPEIITPLTGIEFLQDTRREYPKESIGAQIIGAVNDEGFGISGLEQVYDEILRGIDGYRIMEGAKQVSQNGNPMPMIDCILEEVLPTDGNDIIISIDIDLQQMLEENLQAVAVQRNCTNASAILLDGDSGEIVATASIPLYDRANITQEQVEQGATNAKAITQPFEPGSIFKVIIAAAALEQGLMTAEDSIFCPNRLEIYDKTIKDAVEREDMDMSLRDIIAFSSNIGVSLIEEQLGDELFNEYLERLGLGRFTHVDYPGETPGNLAAVNQWTPIQAANITFGQGLEVSLLQMASIYGAIANDGIMVQPHFLIARPQYDVDLLYDSRRVFDAQTTRDLEDILRSVVTEGYGINANIDGYDVVGKTATAEMSNLEGGYESSDGYYICSFGGYIDNSSSDFVFLSSFENPINYNDSPATKFFRSFMSLVIEPYKIVPEEEAPVAAGTTVSDYYQALERGESNQSALYGGSLYGVFVDAEAGGAGSQDGAGLGGELGSSEVGGAGSGGLESTGQATQGSRLRYPIPRAGIDWIIDTSG